MTDQIAMLVPMLANVDTCEVVFQLSVDVLDDRVMQRLLVALERQYIVGFLLDDLGGDCFLGSHRVDRDDGPLDVHRLQQLGDGRDLVGLLGTDLLPQGQAERYSRVTAMVDTMEEYFGSCTNHGECQAACPKEISIDFIAYMNRDYVKAQIKNRKRLSQD